LKTLEESLSLARRLGRQAHERGQPLLAARFDERAHDAEQRITLIRQVLIRDEPLVNDIGAANVAAAGNTAARDQGQPSRD
jgi:hypothetical protein